MKSVLISIQPKWVKYIARAGKKNPEKEVEDLKKARWYIEREIKRLGG